MQDEDGSNVIRWSFNPLDIGDLIEGTDVPTGYAIVRKRQIDPIRAADGRFCSRYQVDPYGLIF